MQVWLFIYLFSQLLAVFALAHDADQIVLGNLQTLKFFEPTPTISPEMDPIGSKDVNWSTQDDVVSPPQTAPFTSATSGPGLEGVQPVCKVAWRGLLRKLVAAAGIANFWCVCKKGAYVGKAWDCFGQSGCPGPDIGKALGDLNVACRPYRGFAASVDESPESPMITPEGTPAVVLGSNRFDEL